MQPVNDVVALVLVAGCVWEIGVYFLGRDLTGSENAYPALSDLLDPVLAWPPARVLLVGDRRQHRSVSAGEPLRLLEERAGVRAAEVADIVRQQGA